MALLIIYPIYHLLIIFVESKTWWPLAREGRKEDGSTLAELTGLKHRGRKSLLIEVQRPRTCLPQKPRLSQYGQGSRLASLHPWKRLWDPAGPR